MEEKTDMTPSHHPQGISFKATCLRATLYILFIGALMQGVFYEGTHLLSTRFSEAGFTEYMQSTLLGLCSLLLVYIYNRLAHFRHLALLMFAFLFSSLIREQDALLDAYLFDGAWQVLVTLVILPSLYVVIRNRAAFLSEFSRFADSFAFGLFAAGFLCTYVFSRLYGRGSFWEALLAEKYMYNFKSAAEEITELFGYTLLLFAVIELTLLARRYLQQR